MSAATPSPSLQAAGVSPSTASVPSPQDLQARVAYEQVALLHRQTPLPALLGNGFVAVVAALLWANGMPWQVWLGWALFMVATSCWRALETRHFFADPLRRLRVTYWERRYTALMVPYCAGWAVMVPAFGPHVDARTYAILLAGAVGVPALGVFTAFSVRAAAAGFLCTVLLPAAVSFASDGGLPGLGAAVATVVYGGVLGFEAWRANARQAEMFRLQMQLATTAANHAHAQARAEHADHAKSRFLATVSHEVRTPLNGIVGLGELLRADLPAGQTRQRLELLLQSAHHLDRMISDLLDLTRMDVAHLELQRAPFGPGQALHEVVELMRPQALARGCHLLMEPGADTQGLAWGDGARVRQVLYNLLGNAIKFGAGQPVSVRCQRQGERLQYTVEDRGAGIAEDWAERIFQPFERGPAEPGTPGAGLGLAVCRQLARAMGGDISHQPRVGGGTCFNFDLSAPAAPAPIGTPEPAPTQLQGQVLVVDDNEVNALVARAMLEQLGLQVDVASDGQAALDRMAAKRFDAVLMDVQMPGIDGLQATRQWRAREQASAPGMALPILGLTANVSGEDRRACLASGMNAVLAKPCSMDVLARAMVQYLPRVAHPAASLEAGAAARAP